MNGRSPNGTATSTARVVPGPTLKLGEPIPCGCRVCREPDGRLRLWFCRTHLAAFDTLEALQTAARALDRASAGRHDDQLEDARFVVRGAIHKARHREPWG